MAGIARPLRRSPAASDGSKFWSRFFFVLDIAIVIGILVSAFVVFRYYPDAWEGTYVALGYGWIPALLWAGSVLVALRYRPSWLIRFWNLWLAGACAVILTVGILTFFEAGYGPLAFVGLGGKWGSIAMGDSMLLGIARLAPLALVIPILILPRKAVRGYWLGLAYAIKGLWAGLVALARGIAFVAVAIGRGVASLFSNDSRPGWVNAVLRFPRSASLGAVPPISPD